MNQKTLANKYQNIVTFSAIFTFIGIVVAAIFPEVLSFFEEKPTRLFGILLIIGGVYSLLKKEAYTIKTSFGTNLLLGWIPIAIYSLPNKSFRRHTGLMVQIWCIVVILLGVLMVV